MQIIINLKIFLFLFLFILTKQIKIYALLMIFGFIHELGHLLMGVLLGLKTESISIMPIGFNIKFKGHTYISEYKKIFIALAGPIVNLTISLFIYIYYFVSKNEYIFNTNIDLIIYSNILIFAFNLIPIYPLDGGRILKSIIRLKKDYENTEKISKMISYITIIIMSFISSIIILILKNWTIVFAILYLWILVLKNNK